MENKKTNDLDGFFNTIKKALYINITKIDEEEEILDDLISKLDEVGFSEQVELILNYANIYYIFMQLDKIDYDDFVCTKFQEKSLIKYHNLFYFEGDTKTDTMYITELFKTKTRTTRKSLGELELELEEALKKENYELAATLNKKITTKKKNLETPPKPKKVKKPVIIKKKK